MTQASAPVRWQETPPPQDLSYIRAVWPKVNQPINGIILCQRPTGCWGHPIEGENFRFVGCIGKDEGCDHCAYHRPLRWAGYVSILDPKTGRIQLACLTKEAAKNCPPLCDKRRQLRGMCLHLARAGASKFGRVHAEVSTGPAGYPLPKPPDVAHRLLLLWGLYAKWYDIADIGGAK